MRLPGNNGGWLPGTSRTTCSGWRDTGTRRTRGLAAHARATRQRIEAPRSEEVTDGGIPCLAFRPVASPPASGGPHLLDRRSPPGRSRRFGAASGTQGPRRLNTAATRETRRHGDGEATTVEN